MIKKLLCLLPLVSIAFFSMPMVLYVHAADAIPLTFEKGYVHVSTGGLGTGSNDIRSNAISVTAGQMYEITIESTIPVKYRIHCWSAGGSYYPDVGVLEDAEYSGPIQFVVPSGVSQIRLNLKRLTGSGITVANVTYAQILLVDDEPPDDSSSVPEPDSSSSTPDPDSSSSTSIPEGNSEPDDASSIPPDSESIPPASSDDDPRPFLETPLNDYTVTEGILLVIMVIAMGGVLLAVFRGR